MFSTQIKDPPAVGFSYTNQAQHIASTFKLWFNAKKATIILFFTALLYVYWHLTFLCMYVAITAKIESCVILHIQLSMRINVD